MTAEYFQSSAAEQVINTGVQILDEIGSDAIKGRSVELDSDSVASLNAAADTYTDPTTGISANTQLRYMRALLGVVTPSMRSPEFAAETHDAFAAAVEANPHLKAVIAPEYPHWASRAALIERVRGSLPNSYTDDTVQTGLRAPDEANDATSVPAKFKNDTREVIEYAGPDGTAQWYTQRYKRLGGGLGTLDTFTADLLEAGVAVETEDEHGLVVVSLGLLAVETNVDSITPSSSEERRALHAKVQPGNTMGANLVVLGALHHMRSEGPSYAVPEFHNRGLYQLNSRQDVISNEQDVAFAGTYRNRSDSLRLGEFAARLDSNRGDKPFIVRSAVSPVV